MGTQTARSIPLFARIEGEKAAPHQKGWNIHGRPSRALSFRRIETGKAGNMSRSNTATLDSRSNRFVLTHFVWRQIASLAGFVLVGALALAIAALSTWNVADPSFSYATSNEPTNLLGYGGAVFADIFMQFFGLASVVALLP